MTATERLGIVIARFRKGYAVEDERGAVIQCSARSRTATAICGDRVRWQASGAGRGIITAILPRHTVLGRPDSRGRLREIAANIDQIIVVSAVPDDGHGQPRFNLDLIDRYLVAAENIGIPPLILANKIDLIGDRPADAQRAACEALRDYSDIGYTVIATSTKSTHGLDELIAQLPHRTSIFVGESGTGKSSLIRQLLPDQDIRIGAVSAATGLGRHTTSTTTLYHLPSGGDLIDSPGVREFSLWHIGEAQLLAGFREFRPLCGECRFRNCRHNGEQGCRLAQAAAEGAISQRRLDSYRSMLASLADAR